MARRYFLSPLPGPGRHLLPAELSHHLLRVMRLMRLSAGAAITLFDGEGRESQARLLEAAGGGSRPRLEVELGPHRRAGREPRLRLELAFALPKGGRRDWLFEHGTELGIAAFRPLQTKRSQGRRGQAGGPGQERIQRWRRLMQAACGQCDRALLPTLHAQESLAEMLASPGLPEERYLAKAGAAPLGPARSQHALLLVGPEGGLTKAEEALCQEQDFLPRRLGPLTLRSETAVLAGAILLLQELAEGKKEGKEDGRAEGTLSPG